MYSAAGDSLNDSRNPRRAVSSFSRVLGRSARQPCSSRSGHSLARLLSTPPGTSPTLRFPASRSVAGPKLRTERDSERLSCSSMKSIAWGGWAARLKGQWDLLQRRHLPLHVVATGSSALRVATGSRESLAGRFERLTLSHWSASSLALTFHVPPEEASLDVVRFGCYPGAVALREDPARWRAYIKDAIVEPAITRDVLMLGTVRRPALLRQVFAIAAASPAQIVSLQKLQGQLQDKGAIETVAHYLTLLEEAYLVAPLERFSVRAHRRRAAPPKLVTLNNALLSAMHAEGAPDASREPERFGFWVENACLALAVNQGQRVTYWREEPWEIDAVIEGSWGNWALEVKTSRFELQDLKGLLEFCRRNPKFRPLVITAPGGEMIAERHGLSALSWKEFLLSGPPSAAE